MKYVFYTLLLAMVGFVLYVRFTPSDPDIWHVDPLDITDVNSKNGFLLHPEYGDQVLESLPLNVQDLTSRLSIILSNTGTLLKGDLTDGHATYVVRSKFFGFPDYLSVRILDAPNGTSKLAIYSRARYGVSDIGVNKARVLRIISALGQ